ncbi:family 16 glycosylhydrolase [Arachnia propionica]|uniref:glycoside hydrolase family 16 protein n=1 Tax=Arachnia propionica TaxID=1750 RepID=UPI0021AB1E63|nr:family 16 glycosylhydrolase [Arachnia propionica]
MTSAVATVAISTTGGSSVAEPVVEPVARTAPSATSASPARSASLEPESEPEPAVAELPYAPSEAVPVTDGQQDVGTEQATAEGTDASATEAEPSEPAPSPRPKEQGDQNRTSRAQNVVQRENVTAGAGSGQGRESAEIPGWRMDYFEGFEGSIEDTGWERYGWGNPAVGQGAMGFRAIENTFTSGGEMLVRTKYENGQWSAGGASTKQVFTASRGRWEVRARMPQAKGIGYVFLLWPKDEGWPPEIDFAEGRVNGPEVMGVYHWDPDNKQEHRFFDNHSMHDWHTYGVIVEETEIIFTIDGQEWGRIEKNWITDKEMFLAIQTGAMDPNGSEAQYETVPNGVPGPETPGLSDVQIDWVAHYTRG